MNPACTPWRITRTPYKLNSSFVYILAVLAAAVILLPFLLHSNLPIDTSFTQQAHSKTMAGIRLIPSRNLHVSKPTWWLESRFHFSFADYFNPANTNFGALRVCNDDLVKPRSGFGRHPHRNQEIFSYVVDGQLSHADSMGNTEALGRGCVQYLSAGTGITHSEMNEGDVTCRFLQVWISPDKPGHQPQYGSREFSKEDRHNKLLQILGGTSVAPVWEHINKPPEPIALHQDCNVFVSESDAGKSYEIALAKGRQAYLVCIEGDMTVNGNQMEARDAAELTATTGALPLALRMGNQGGHFMLIEMQLKK